MNDFFDDLERQLVAATPQRQARLRRARTRRAATVAATAVVLLAGGVGIATAVGGDEQDGGGAPAARTTTPPAPTTETTIPRPGAVARPGTYEVAVLNATTVPGLARGVANRLQNDKYKIGNVTNAASQDRAATVVEYAPGHRAEARDVATVIDVAPDTIRPLSDASRVIAGDGATVVVLVGSDQNLTHRP